MNKYITILLLLSLVTLNISGQKDKKLVRQGNKLYEDKKYSDAEVSYKKALEKKSNSISASYNLGNALYRQEKMQDAADQYARLADEKELSKQQLGMVYHNMGNSLLQSKKNEKNDEEYKKSIEESIEAYKNALRNNPSDLETKSNLAFAQRLLKNQPKQNQQNKQDNKDQKDKDKKKDKNKNDKDKNQNKNQDQKKDNKNKQDQNKQQQQQEGKLTKDAAKRMLEAIQNDEKNLKEKLEKQKAVAKKVKPDQDW